VPLHTAKAYRGVEVQFHTFLTLTRKRSMLSTSSSGRSIPVEPQPSRYWILEYRVALQASPNVLVNRKFSRNKQQLIPRSRALHDKLTTVRNFNKIFFHSRRAKFQFIFLQQSYSALHLEPHQSNPRILSLHFPFWCYTLSTGKSLYKSLLFRFWFFFLKINIPFMRAKQKNVWGCRVDSSGSW